MKSLSTALHDTSRNKKNSHVIQKETCGIIKQEINQNPICTHDEGALHVCTVNHNRKMPRHYKHTLVPGFQPTKKKKKKYHICNKKKKRFV